MEQINNLEDLRRVAEAFKDGTKKSIRCMVPICMVKMIQLRKTNSTETVKKYAAAMKEGATMPPANGNLDIETLEIYCYDGAHRIEARKLNGETHIPMDLTPGTKRDATLNAAGVNEEHGLPRNKEDKFNAVDTVLADPECSCRSSSWIADLTKTSVPYVEALRKKADKAAKELGKKTVAPRTRLVKRNGCEYEMVIPEKPAKDPVDVILGKFAKMVGTLNEADRDRLLKAIIKKLGGKAA